MMDNVYKNHLNESSDLIHDLAKLSGFTVDEFNNRIYELLNKDFKGETLHADNTSYIGNNSLSDLLLPALMLLEDHSTRNDNPHEETTESIGTLTVDEIESLDVGDGIRSGLYPLDVIGYDTRTWDVQSLNSVILYNPANDGTIEVTDEVFYSIYATPYVLEPDLYRIQDQCPNWPYVDVYLYMGLDKGSPTLMLHETKVPDTVARIYMATIDMYARNISSLDPVIRMSGKRLSDFPMTDALPVGTGKFMDNVKLHPGWLGGIGDLTPDRPDGMDISFRGFSQAAGGRLYTLGDTPLYVLYTDYLTAGLVGDDFEGEVDRVARFNCVLSGNITSLVWNLTLVSGQKVELSASIEGDNEYLFFEVSSLPIGLSLLKVTATNNEGKQMEQSVYIEGVEPLRVDLVDVNMTKVSGAYDETTHYHYYNGIVNVEYEIMADLKGKDLVESYSYTPTSGLPAHSGTIVKLSSGLYTLKFANGGGGIVKIDGVDKYGTKLTQTIVVNVDSEGPPVYNPKFVGITATGQRVPIDADPNFAWYNTYKNNGTNFMSFTKWEIEFVGAATSYTYELVTLESMVTPGFTALLLPVPPNKVLINMYNANAIPPFGSSVQYIKVNMIVKNSIGQAVSKTYYLRFING